MARLYTTAHFGPGYEILNVARTLAETGTFGNPYTALPTGPTAHVAPIYPMFLALLIKLFGYATIFVVLTSGLVLVMHGLHAMLMPRVSALFFGHTGPGYWAAILSILLPLFPFLPQFELMYDAVGLMDALLPRRRPIRPPAVGAPRARHGRVCRRAGAPQSRKSHRRWALDRLPRLARARIN